MMSEWLCTDSEGWSSFLSVPQNNTLLSLTLSTAAMKPSMEPALAFFPCHPCPHNFPFVLDAFQLHRGLRVQLHLP